MNNKIEVERRSVIVKELRVLDETTDPQAEGKTIEGYAFYNCQNITKLKIPNSVTSFMAFNLLSATSESILSFLYVI